MSPSISSIEFHVAGPSQAFALALVCRACGCRTGEEDLEDGILLHIVGPDSVLVELEQILPRIALDVPEGPRSWAIGFGVAVAEAIQERITVPDLTMEVEREFWRRFEGSPQPDEVLDLPVYHDGFHAGQAMATQL